MEQVKVKKDLFDRIGWIILVSFFILFLSEGIGEIIIPSINISHAYGYTFMIYFSFITLWASCLIVILAFKKNRFILASLTRKSKGNSIKNLLVGLSIGLLLNGLCAFIAWLHGDFRLELIQIQVFPISMLFLAVFIQSSAEELLCRGFLYQRLLKSTHEPIVVILINSLFFTFIHLSNDGISLLALYDIFITGIFFSLMVHYYHSLWMAMGAHASWNFTQSILLGLPNSGMSFPYAIYQVKDHPLQNSFAYDIGFGLEGTILSSILFTVACIVMYWWYKQDKHQLMLRKIKS